MERLHGTGRSAKTEFWSLYDGPLTVADVGPDLARYEFFLKSVPQHPSFYAVDSNRLC